MARNPSGILHSVCRKSFPVFGPPIVGLLKYQIILNERNPPGVSPPSLIIIPDGIDLICLFGFDSASPRSLAFHRQNPPTGLNNKERIDCGKYSVEK